MIRESPACDPSVGGLLRDLSDEMRVLLRQEVDLAKAEIGEKASRLRREMLYLALGAAAVFFAAAAIVVAACIGAAVVLDTVMDRRIAAWLGPLIIAALLALAAYGLIQRGIAAIRRESLVPRKTIDSIRENTEWITHRMTSIESRPKRNHAIVR
jgi:hypothetical protein